MSEGGTVSEARRGVTDDNTIFRFSRGSRTTEQYLMSIGLTNEERVFQVCLGCRKTVQYWSSDGVTDKENVFQVSRSCRPSRTTVPYTRSDGRADEEPVLQVGRGVGRQYSIRGQTRVTDDEKVLRDHKGVSGEGNSIPRHSGV